VLGDGSLHPGDPVGQQRFRFLGAVEGLRNLFITSIAQDANGLLWLATEDGVYRFDGEWFTHFSLEDGLTSTAVSAIAVSPDGLVCAGSRSGMVCWDGQRFSEDKAKGIPPVQVHAMVSFGGKLWVGTENAGLYVQGSAGTFVPAAGWPGGRTSAIRAMWADNDGLVIGDGATLQLSSGDGVWKPIGDIGLAREPISSVLRDRKGALWIRTRSHLWLLTTGAARATNISEGLPSGYNVVGGENGTNVMTIGPRGDVLVATDMGIAYRENDRWRVIGHEAGRPAAPARTVFVDREGTLWIGAVGLFQLRGRGILEHYEHASGRSGDVVWAFRRDRNGTLWIGTGQCLARAASGAWECMPGSEGRVVRAFVFLPDGGMFFGGAPGDLIYVDAHGSVTSMNDFGEAADRTILALALGLQGELWIGTSAGLFRLPGAVPGPIEKIALPGIPGNARFNAFAVADGQLWTATEEGILVLESGEWHRFDKAAGFVSSGMRRLLRRADGRMCASYSEAIGVVCFRYQNGKVWDFEHIGTSEGLTSGMAYFLGEDLQQRLWVGTGGGVDVVTPKGIDHFDESDGLAGNDSTSTAFMVDDDGSLWLGSSVGATHVYAQYYDGPPRAPQTSFLNGMLGDQPITSATTVLEVPHDRASLTVEFVSSSMLDPKRVEYQIRLSPLEMDWSVSRQRKARYPALPPGKYQLEVRARVGAGSWGPTSELKFAVLPAWWQTRWFLPLLALAGLTAMGGLFTLRQVAVLRRRTRLLNERSDASFHAVIDLMPDMISVYRDGRLLYMNRASHRFLGADSTDRRWEAHDLNARIHPDDLPPISKLLRRVGRVDKLETEVIEIRMLGGDGTWRICEMSAVLVEIGGAPTIVSNGRDVTERKRMRAKFLLSDRMASLGTLAAGIAHEINNPLAYVTGNLEAAAETLQSSNHAPTEVDRAELSSVIAEARDGAERVRQIVQGLRSFSRPQQETRAPLELPSVLEAAIRLTANEVRHRAQLVREFGPVPRVLADDGQLTQVFINLLVNAAQAIPDGPVTTHCISVRTRTDDQGWAVAEVEDTGQGMPPDVQSRVFDPFFTTKEIGEGTGLGLSICHGIVSGLGGQISIDSTVGRGTLIRVSLPPQPTPDSSEGTSHIHATLNPTPDEPRNSELQRRRPRVLVIDDEPLVAHTLERLLRRHCETTIALSGHEAIKHIVNGTHFDVIVSDVMMPSMSGVELVEELQRVSPEHVRRLVFLSGGAFTPHIRQQLERLRAPRLAKPVSAKELRAWVFRIASEAASMSK
jgi:PAS domain S-box-containing protein